MIQTLKPLITEYAEENLYFYTNVTNEMQIVRLRNALSGSFERIVFPGERLLFLGVPEAELEIYIGQMGKETLSRRITCNILQVWEDESIIKVVSSPRVATTFVH